MSKENTLLNFDATPIRPRSQTLPVLGLQSVQNMRVSLNEWSILNAGASIMAVHNRPAGIAPERVSMHTAVFNALPQLLKPYESALAFQIYRPGKSSMETPS